MVAEIAPPVTTPIRKKQANPVPLGLQLRLRVRGLYLNQGLCPSEIAAKVGLQRAQVANLVVREGWTKVRKEAQRRIEKRADERMKAEADQVADAIASDCEEIALRSLENARDRAENPLQKDAAKDFQAWTGGVRNLVTVARACRGMDQAPQSAAGSSVNVFVLRCGDLEKSRKSERIEQNVTPVIAS
jgi:hypothetical protein